MNLSLFAGEFECLTFVEGRQRKGSFHYGQIFRTVMKFFLKQNESRIRKVSPGIKLSVNFSAECD